MSKYYWSGTLSTRRLRKWFDVTDPADQAEMAEWADDWGEIDPVAWRFSLIERGCKATLDAASLPRDDRTVLAARIDGVQDDSPQGYALRKLNRLMHMQRFIKYDDDHSRLTALHAFELGRLTKESEMKALADDGHRKNLEKRRAIKNKAKAVAAQNAAIKQEAQLMLKSGQARKNVVEDLMAKFDKSKRTIEPLVPNPRAPKKK